MSTACALTVQPSNTGVFNRTELNAVYEVGIDVGFQLTQRMKVFGGYTFLLWDGAVRSGDQVDRVVQLDQPAGVRPRVPFKDDVFWAQGLNVGLELTWCDSFRNRNFDEHRRVGSPAR